MPANSKTSASWSTNPQYLIKFEDSDELEFFFSLAQMDGRIVRGSKFPFEEQIHPVNLIIYPTTDGKPIKEFDQKKAKPEWISAVVEHKEVSLRAKLKVKTIFILYNLFEYRKECILSYQVQEIQAKKENII